MTKVNKTFYLEQGYVVKIDELIRKSEFRTANDWFRGVVLKDVKDL